MDTLVDFPPQEQGHCVPFNLVEETIAGIPNARLISMEGIGHYPHMETPEFNILVEQFLNSIK